MARVWPALATALVTAACGLPAQAQPPMSPSGSPAAQHPLIFLPPPADIGRPPTNDPWLMAQPHQGDPSSCAPAWPCRLRLFGVIEKNGGIGLKGTALTW
jgi:hypothetical protein